jgi:hypothetical protein
MNAGTCSATCCTQTLVVRRQPQVPRVLLMCCHRHALRIWWCW